MKNILSFLLLVVVLLIPLSAGAQSEFDDAFDALDAAFEESVRRQEDSWNKASAALEKQWEEEVKRTEAEWERLRAEVEQKWDDFYFSTNKEWVEYDENKETRSRVDFEKGEIEVSALVEVDEAAPPALKVGKPRAPLPPETGEKPKEKAGEKVEAPAPLPSTREAKAAREGKEKIVRQVEEIFSVENEVRSPVLAGQVRDEGGEAVTPENVKAFMEKEVAPKIEVQEKPVVGKDGKKRLKVSAKIKLVPKHLEMRADKYKQGVKKYADKYRLDPALLFAMIHTESFFNPLAKSWVPAYGLMQLVPRYGALEAYSYLYDEEKLLPADYLYKPDNNIMLGATYVHLLNSRYFGAVRNEDNRQSLCIAAYNCGPTRLTKKIVGKYNTAGMEEGKFVELIRSVVPKETKDYILKVKQRKRLYEGMEF